jgi:hypothetical protein
MVGVLFYVLRRPPADERRYVRVGSRRSGPAFNS